MVTTNKAYVVTLADRSTDDKGGSKAKNLRFLLRHDFLVPTGYVVTWDALDDYKQHGVSVLNSIRTELVKIIHHDQYYAVRSSASVEDDVQFSYAGIFRSILKVKGIDSILENIKLVWDSLTSTEFLTYQNNNPVDRTSVKMAVIIQEMVPALYSGVIFSRNPLTGLSETIIEAGIGTGEDQTMAKSDPERWVAKWGSWLQKPQEGHIPEELVLDFIKQAKAIEKKFGQPIDLEWAYDGKTLYFLQVRPITRLDIPAFSNRISREMLPGIIKPLVWSVNTRLVNQTWVDILKLLTGDQSFEPEKLTGHFYYRAYFNITVFGRVFERFGMPYEALELLFGLENEGPDKPHMRPGYRIITRLPRFLAFAIRLLRIESQLARLLKTKRKNYERLISQMSPSLSERQWIELANQVFNETKPVAYFNIMIPMLAMMQHRMLMGMLKKHGVDGRLLELKGLTEASERSGPHHRLKQLHQKYYANGSELIQDDVLCYQKDLDEFLAEFGHFSDSGNDCSSIPWRETPDLIRQMIALNSPERSDSISPMCFEDLKLPWYRRGILRLIYHRTSRFAVHRETISSLYTFGYGQFRRCFIGLGALLVEQGVLEQSDDIFYLYWQELVDLIDNPVKPSQKERVLQRKQDIDLYRDAVLPDMIFGLTQPPLKTQQQSSLRGIPTSLGTYTGPARVLSSLTDFHHLKDGDVLVIPFSDVGWTPLFSRAGAVVAESGGILSHSSIVAREYRIPAVVSVSGACRIADGTILTVNGYTGEVLTAEVMPTSAY